ncbi:MAG: hypothetical protein Q8900_09525 [Bacillota bacterium]|nr:hypothetical protein [Bacillota bacterium]
MVILNSVTPTTPTKQQFDNIINEILSQPGYKHLKNPITEMIDKAKQYIFEQLIKLLIKLFSGFGVAPATASSLSTVFIIAGIIVVAVLIIIISIKIIKRKKKNRKVKEILGEKIDDKTTPSSLRGKAESFEREGELRKAVRYDFIAILLLMHENSLLYLDEAKTNEENYRFLREHKFILLSTFHFLINTFNSCWYGNKSCSPEMYEKWKRNIDDIWNGVISGEIKNK